MNETPRAEGRAGWRVQNRKEKQRTDKNKLVLLSVPLCPSFGPPSGSIGSTNFVVLPCVCTHTRARASLQLHTVCTRCIRCNLVKIYQRTRVAFGCLLKKSRALDCEYSSVLRASVIVSHNRCPIIESSVHTLRARVIAGGEELSEKKEGKWNSAGSVSDLETACGGYDYRLVSFRARVLNIE